MAKVFVSETVDRVIDRAVQICGSLGVSDELPLADFYREARAFRIYDGASEVHRMSIARRVLRERSGGERCSISYLPHHHTPAGQPLDLRQGRDRDIALRQGRPAMLKQLLDDKAGHHHLRASVLDDLGQRQRGAPVGQEVVDDRHAQPSLQVAPEITRRVWPPLVGEGTMRESAGASTSGEYFLA